MNETWRRILEHRSVADKFCVPRDCELCPVDDLPAVSEMVREGVVRWIDRQTFQGRINDSPKRVAFDCDIYQLTLKGIKLCNENGIERQ
jgi:hypothetical protein